MHQTVGYSLVASSSWFGLVWFFYIYSDSLSLTDIFNFHGALVASTECIPAEC